MRAFEYPKTQSRNGSKEELNFTFMFAVIEPISSNAKLRLHTKPEKDNFSLPKILLNVVFDEIAIALNKAQVSSSTILILLLYIRY